MLRSRLLLVLLPAVACLVPALAEARARSNHELTLRTPTATTSFADLRGVGHQDWVSLVPGGVRVRAGDQRAPIAALSVPHGGYAVAGRFAPRTERELFCIFGSRTNLASCLRFDTDHLAFAYGEVGEWGDVTFGALGYEDRGPRLAGDFLGLERDQLVAADREGDVFVAPPSAVDDGLIFVPSLPLPSFVRGQSLLAGRLVPRRADLDGALGPHDSLLVVARDDGYIARIDFDLASDGMPIATTTFREPLAGLVGTDASIADIDGDGYDDLVLQKRGAAPSFFRLGDGEGRQALEPMDVSATGIRTGPGYSVRWADFGTATTGEPFHRDDAISMGANDLVVSAARRVGGAEAHGSWFTWPAVFD